MPAPQSLSTDSVILRIGSLPPAYAEVERLVGLLQPDGNVAKDAELDAFIAATGPFDTSRLSLAERKDFNFRAHALHAHLFSTFAQIFKAEVSSGHFEIFEAETFFSVINNYTVSPFLSSVFEDCDLVFDAMLEALKVASERFYPFLLARRQTLSTRRLDQLWEALKETLSQEAAGSDWDIEECIKARNPQPHMLDRGYATSLFLALRSFFGCTQASARLLAEAAALTPAILYTLVADFRINVEEGAIFKNPLPPIFHPLVLEKFFSDFFNTKLLQSGADRKVVNLLIFTWEGDLDSLLIAAKTLSAESA